MKIGVCKNNHEIHLASSEKAPFNFKITIIESVSRENSKCNFEVAGKDIITGFTKMCQYYIQNRQPTSYLDFFEKLAKDFGLGLPQNRQPVGKHSFKIKYNTLLSKNLTPEILYGYGDPAVIRVNNESTGEISYYLVSTSNDAPNSFPICRSQNLKDWELVSFVFPKGMKPEWAADGEFISDYWAAEMHKIGDEFRVYFVARDKTTLELCIGMAKSSTPDGQFIADKEPILKGNMIDPHIFSENDKSTFLYWKEDNNGIWPSRLVDLLYKHPALITSLFPEEKDQITASFIQTLWPWIQTLKSMESFLVQHILIEAITSEFAAFEGRLKRLSNGASVEIQEGIKYVLEVMKTPVYAQMLSPDGSTLLGAPKKIIENDLPWEAHLVEGMWVTKHLNKYYLFYSANDFSTDQYGVGVSIADNPLGPFRKKPRPILKSTEDWWAPGHPSIAIGPDGKYQLFLHAYFPGQAGYKEFRALLSVPVTFNAENVVLQ